jgi:NAD(P)-dependent dehydrogenase (short-subunit alcohol dehydrogenase family)
LKDLVVRQAALRAIPMNRFGERIELAQSILFRASPEAYYITGQILVVDGGATIP